MIYSPTVTAVICLNNYHDSLLYKIAKVKCPVKKIKYTHQELRIMSCLLELMDTLPEEAKSQVMDMIKVEI